MFCRLNLAKPVIYSFYTIVVNNGLCEPFLLLKNSSFPLRLSESQTMSNLGHICQNSEAKILKPVLRPKPVFCSLIKHTVSANLSALNMETLFYLNKDV